MRVLVTGGAGFIGSHLVDRLLLDGHDVTIVDNFDPFYDPAVKRSQIGPSLQNPRCTLREVDVRDGAGLRESLRGDFDAVVHLAARAGVRPSLADPSGYQETNVGGTQNVLELAKERGVKRFVFGSSSSVYGVNQRVPWSENDHVLLPISPYASTKVAGELLGHVYSHLYGIRFLALRFFTVYGPRQRPDLAFHKFARRMVEGLPIPVFGDGTTRRDYTYVSDVVQAVCAALRYDGSIYEVINVGNDRTVSLSEAIKALEKALGVSACIERQPQQPGDVPQTWANIHKAQNLLGYSPDTALAEGLAAFAEWMASSPARASIGNG